MAEEAPHKIDLDVYKEPEVEITLGGVTKRHNALALNKQLRLLWETMATHAKEGAVAKEYAVWDQIKALFGFPEMSDGQAKQAADQVADFIERLYDRKNS